MEAVWRVIQIRRSDFNYANAAVLSDIDFRFEL